MKDKPNSISEQVESAQEQLCEKVRLALVEFTDATGLVCPHIRWRAESVLNESGRTIKTAYWDFGATIQTGA